MTEQLRAFATPSEHRSSGPSTHARQPAITGKCNSRGSEIGGEVLSVTMGFPN